MLKKHNRILWLLNHKTLMPFELGLLIDLGFEVFTPKVIPSKNFRSGAVDFSYDASLTLPAAALERLNSFNFYEDVWPKDIVKLVNRYFGTAFILPVARQVSEAVDKFEGRIVFRTFGLDNTVTYKWVLQAMYGAGLFNKIHALGERFWFGEGYEQLHECEPPLLARRAIHLPIGVPKDFWKTENKWIGTDQKILFVCPNLVTNPYYAAIYRDFKEQFGDLPHAIVGAQDVPVDDPHVLGFVSDAELERLYLHCAVLYYHSTELRHVHYSPIEAAINGMPVVFFRDSLLGSMAEEGMRGMATSVQEARAMIVRILDGDQPFIQELRQAQRTLAYQFSAEYCKPIWERNLSAMGLQPGSRNTAWAGVMTREATRLALAPWAKGLARLPSRAAMPLPRRSDLLLPSETMDERSIADGIDFRDKEYPGFVREIAGLSDQEFWGRWSDAGTVRISLYDEIAGRFRLIIVGGAYGENKGAAFRVRIGKARRTASFSSDPQSPETLELEFNLRKPASCIEIIVPHPVNPPNDGRHIGLGFVRLQIQNCA